MQFLHQIFKVSALLLDDALKPATPLTNGAINKTLRQIRQRSSEVKRPTLIVTKFFINKQQFQKTLTKCQWRQWWCQ